MYQRPSTEGMIALSTDMIQNLPYITSCEIGVFRVAGSAICVVHHVLAGQMVLHVAHCQWRAGVP